MQYIASGRTANEGSGELRSKILPAQDLKNYRNVQCLRILIKMYNLYGLLFRSNGRESYTVFHANGNLQPRGV